MDKKKCCGIACLTCGLILFILAFVFWVIISGVIISSIKEENFILSPQSAMYSSWECGWRDDGKEYTPMYEIFYVLNMTNPQEVLNGGIPLYEEKGPYCYRANYTKFKISFLDNDVIEYKRFKSFFQDSDCSLGNSDSDVITNINSGYVGAIAAGGSESTIIIILAGPAISRLIADIELYVVNQTLIPEIGFENLLLECQDRDSDCQTTTDMAMVQFGYKGFGQNFGLNNSQITELRPDIFTHNNGEYSSYPSTISANSLSISTIKKLLYGPYGIALDPSYFEWLQIYATNATALEEGWELSIVQATNFLIYSAVGLTQTYSLDLMNQCVAEGSGFLRTRTVWQVLWEDIEPLLLILQPWEPYGNIFWNNTSIEQADQMTGFWQINNGKTDTHLVEDLIMWEDYTVVDYFWPGFPVPVSGNSGNGQFPPYAVDWRGKTPEVLDDIYAWSPDHGRAVVFYDTEEKVELFGVDTHKYSMKEDTYALNSTLFLFEGFYGFVNATAINDGTIVFYSQPRFLYTDQVWRDKAPGLNPPTEADKSSLWFEPVSGLTLKVEVKLQVNFYIPNVDNGTMFNVLYPNVQTHIMFPLVWTEQVAELGAEDAQRLNEELFSLLDTVNIIWIILWVLAPLCLIIAIVLLYSASKPKGYQEIKTIQ